MPTKMKSLTVFLLLYSAICVWVNNATNSSEYIKDVNDNKVDETFLDKLLNLIMRYKNLNSSQELSMNTSNDLSPQNEFRTRELNISDSESCDSRSCVQELLDIYNTSCVSMKNLVSLSRWNFKVNMTKENSKKKTEASMKVAAWKNKMTKLFKIIKEKNIPGLNNEEKRQLNKIVTTALSRNMTVVKELSKINNKIAEIYSTGTVFYNGKALTSGEIGVVDFFTKNRNCSALTEVWKGWRDATGKEIRQLFQKRVRLLNIGARENEVWKGWRDATGKEIRQLFQKRVRLLNIGARENGYPDYGYYEWEPDFEQKDFPKKVMDLYNELLPHYKEFHAYVRYKLKQFYPNCVDSNGPIPAQLLGNVWAQKFHTIFDILKPYPKVNNADVSSALRSDKWTVMKMFKAAEEFFQSIGLFKMTDKFWKYSMFTKPKSRNVSCHGSASDLFSYGDYRIKMCTTLTEAAFTIAHHEMGHVEYYMAYEKQPCCFRDGANSGFHEAIGDTISLSAGSNSHLQSLNLLKHYNESDESDINTLMYQALKKLAFIPFGLMVDTWRWRVFNGTITPDNYNKEWWKLREQLQGLKPPVKRTEDDFDPGAKYHVSNNVPYIRYFFSVIAQFQFYEAMCKASGHQGPLFKCDFYYSKEAGALLKSMMSLGESKPWPEAMKLMTGQSKIKVDSFVRYFEPLLIWLKQYRLKEKYQKGW